MSLKSFLKSADVCDRFKIEFTTPPFDSIKELAAPPMTQNHSLVGTAFDYLLRFYIERLNPNCKTSTWIAHQFDDCSVEIHVILTKAEMAYLKYLESGKIDDDLLRGVLYLAQLDAAVRRDVDDSYLNTIGEIDSKDIQDLKNLISLVQPKTFRAKKSSILNPNFGRASELVGGADCDLVIDDTLIEIKTTKYFKMKREYYDQLMGYYALYRMGGVEGAPKGHLIKRLGIYFSRHGHLWVFNVSDVIGEKQFFKFSSWFKKRAKQQFQGN